MEHGYLLSILYEMALVIGGEISVKPLLTKVLQRLLYHTSFPAGFVCLAPLFPAADAEGMIEIKLEAAVGDFELAGLVGKTVRLPARLLQGETERGEDAALLAALPNKSAPYSAYLRLPIEGQGVIVLLAPHLPNSELPLTQLFRPLMGSLSRAILLCKSYDAYTGSLIAARDASQQALASSEEKFRAISTAVLDALIMVDDLGTLVFWNPAAERILGYRADEAVGKPLHLLLAPQRYRDSAVQGFEAFRNNGQGPVIGKTIETEALHKDGREIPVELSISALNLDGRWHAVGILRDISEYKRAEATRTQLAAIVESSNDAIIGKDLNGIVNSWNKGAEKIYGYSAAEIIGKSITVLAPPERHAEIEGFLEKIRKGETVVNYESERTRKDGERIYVALTLSPIRDASGKIVGISTIARDISERKQAEKEINALNRELEQRVIARTADLEAANKELEAFSFSVSHDLRTPLRAIDGFSQILLEDYANKLDAEGMRLLNVVRDNTRRMGELIDDILKFSRAGRVELSFVEIDMEALAREVYAELLVSVVADKLQLEIAALPPARGDRAMMHQVFANLLSNAIKFSRHSEPPKIEVGAYAEGNETVYFVRDNGVGFDMQYIGKLFGVFQRLHGVEEFEGTGIGLAIVKRVVARHGGRVWAESKVGAGATFYFALPQIEGKKP